MVLMSAPQQRPSNFDWFLEQVSSSRVNKELSGITDWVRAQRHLAMYNEVPEFASNRPCQIRKASNCLKVSPFFDALRKKGFSFFSCGATSSRTVPKTQPLEVAFSLRERVGLRSQKGRILGKKIAWGREGVDRKKKGKKDAQKKGGKWEHVSAWKCRLHRGPICYHYWGRPVGERTSKNHYCGTGNDFLENIKKILWMVASTGAKCGEMSDFQYCTLVILRALTLELQRLPAALLSTLSEHT